MLNNRISIFVNLPLATLDTLSLQKRLDAHRPHRDGRRRRCGLIGTPASNNLERQQET